MTTTDWIQAIAMVVLVGITIFYAWQTKKASGSVKASAEASLKMAEEMREQRVMTSRPVIIQQAVNEHEKKIRPDVSLNYFSHFEVYNVGNGPALEVEISLLNKQKIRLESARETFLRADETPIKFRPSNIADLEESTYYLLCEYQSILSREIWYQTWLPFKKEDKIFVNAGLEFREVLEEDGIDAFSRRSKPK